MLKNSLALALIAGGASFCHGVLRQTDPYLSVDTVFETAVNGGSGAFIQGTNGVYQIRSNGFYDISGQVNVPGTANLYQLVNSMQNPNNQPGSVVSNNQAVAWSASVYGGLPSPAPGSWSVTFGVAGTKLQQVLQFTSVDTTPPLVSIDIPNSCGFNTSGQVQIAGWAGDHSGVLSAVLIIVDGNAPVLVSQPGQLPLQPWGYSTPVTALVTPHLAPQNHTLQLLAIDPANNWGYSQTINCGF